MFRIKFCGITSIADAQAAVAAGADAIGLNFFSGSPRHVSIEMARKIAAAVPRGVCKVGVFVNAPADEIRRVTTDLALDLAQLHGDEDPQVLCQLKGIAVMRAFGVGLDLSAIAQYLDACHKLVCLPRLALVDTARPGQYGGTGAVLDWNLVSQQRQAFRGLPLVLAGGLTPDNVAQAMALVRPWAVDVASGVEQGPGQKSPEKMQAFAAAARAAAAQLAHAG